MHSSVRRHHLKRHRYSKTGQIWTPARLNDKVGKAFAGVTVKKVAQEAATRGCGLLVAVAVLAAAILPAVTYAQADIDRIKRVLTDQVDAWNRGEVEGYMKGYWDSDSTLFVSGGSVTRGYQELLARYRSSYGTREKMGRLEFSDLTIRLLSERAAVATGVWRLYRAQDEPWGRFTLIFEKKPDGWRITHDHTSLGD
ncbi:MAG: DUF4440 domain-containing protein [Ignavibacteria bacterium]|nr:DUF4440 domain-containing protein [Ignavibacteria bacterium]